jgi:predicted nucleotidyltransferase
VLGLLLTSRERDLDQIIWSILDKKLSYETFLTYLKSFEGIEALKKIPANRANQLLGLSNLTDLNKPAISQAFVDHFTNFENYKKIFKQ